MIPCLLFDPYIEINYIYTYYKGPVASIATLGPSVDAAAAEGGETLGQDGHEQDELHLKIFKSAASGIKNRYI